MRVEFSREAVALTILTVESSPPTPSRYLRSVRGPAAPLGVGLNSAAVGNPVKSRTGVLRDTVPTRQRLRDLASKGLSVAVTACLLVAVFDLSPEPKTLAPEPARDVRVNGIAPHPISFRRSIPRDMSGSGPSLQEISSSCLVDQVTSRCCSISKTFCCRPGRLCRWWI